MHFLSHWIHVPYIEMSDALRANPRRLSLSEGVGPLSLEKRADAVDSLLGALQTAYRNPRTSGAVIGAALGAFNSPKGENKKETARNTIGSLLGGAMSGAIVGSQVARVSNPDGHPFSELFDSKLLEKKLLRPAPPLKELITGMVTTGYHGPAAGRALMKSFAPAPAPPSSLVSILGDKKKYSDQDLVNKYNQEMRERKLTPDREEQFVGALRDLYKTVDSSKGDPISKKEFAKKLMPAAWGIAAPIISQTMITGDKPRDAVLRSAPSLVMAGAGLVQSFRSNFLDKKIETSNKEEAKTRASFNDDQLRRLLKGLQVKQVREHAIK